MLESWGENYLVLLELGGPLEHINKRKGQIHESHGRAITRIGAERR
jgi:hypothetical protein